MIPRRKRRQPMVTLTPVMDVVFLLIVFFILSSHFVQGDVDKITPAQALDIDVIEKPPPYNVSIDADGVVWLQGVETSGVQLAASLEGLIGEREDRRVKVSIDKDIPKQVYFPVIEAISKAGAMPIVTGEKPPK